jgi:hypothetical protein
LVWRQANGIDEILKWNPPEVLLKYFSYGKVGYDKLNSPGQYKLFIMELKITKTCKMVLNSL